MLSISQLHSHFLKSKGVSIDTRTILDGQLFFALRGDRFDGHDYVDHALSLGAQNCVVDREEFRNQKCCLYFPNVMATLHRLARFHRDTFDVPILAITGSNGKTTTKELLYAVISSKFNALATDGNLNNHLGVPLTLLRLKNSHDFAIIEMGANHVGEIKWLCQIARPTHGVITNIGSAHLEGFGSLDNIKKAKSELFHFLDGNEGVIFHNDEEASLNFVPGVFTNVRSFSSNEMMISKANVIFSEDSLFQGFKIGNDAQVMTQLYGRFNRKNILTAIAIGTFFGVSPEAISSSIKNYRPSNNRSQLVKIGGNTFYLDAYNANPTSMMAALDFFAKLNHSQKVIILGDMLELGEDTPIEHRKILSAARAVPGVQKIIVVGELFGQILKDMRDPSINAFIDVHEAKDYFEQQNYQDNHVLIKGSRGIQLEKLVQ